MKKSGTKEEEAGASPSQLIDARIKELGDWRGEVLARVRKLIKQADLNVLQPTACFRDEHRIYMTTMVILEGRR
jgi:hypothetical protein